jgi:hypothetical protein
LIPGVHAASHFFKSLIRTFSFIEGFWLTKPSAMSPIRGTTSASELLIVHPGDRIHQASHILSFNLASPFIYTSPSLPTACGVRVRLRL